MHEQGIRDSRDFVSGQTPEALLTSQVDDIVTNIRVILETAPNACISNPKFGIDIAWQRAYSPSGVQQRIAKTLAREFILGEPRLEGLTIQHRGGPNSRRCLFAVRGTIRGAAYTLELTVALRSQRWLVLKDFTISPIVRSAR